MVGTKKKRLSTPILIIRFRKTINRRKEVVRRRRLELSNAFVISNSEKESATIKSIRLSTMTARRSRNPFVTSITIRFTMQNR